MLTNRIRRSLGTAASVLVLFTAGAAALSSSLGAQESDPDLKAIESYRLTMATLNRMAQANEYMYATLKAHPELAHRYAQDRENEADEPNSIDDMAKKLDKIPEVKQAIVRSGLTTREFMIASLALFQAGMTAAMLEMPGADRSQVSANTMANIAFMKAHKVEFDRMQARSAEIDRLTRPAAHEESTAPDSSDSPLR